MRKNPVIVRAWPEDRVTFRKMKIVKQDGRIESDQDTFNRLLKKLSEDTNKSAMFSMDNKLLRGLRK